MFKLRAELPGVHPTATERGREVRYGTGWHWSPLGDGRSALVPLSTAYECPSTRWHHAETCAVDRVIGTGCNCRVPDSAER